MNFLHLVLTIAVLVDDYTPPYTVKHSSEFFVENVINLVKGQQICDIALAPRPFLCYHQFIGEAARVRNRYVFPKILFDRLTKLPRRNGELTIR